MKYLLSFIALAAITTPAMAATPNCANPKTIAIVDGMVCDFCAQGLIKTFQKNPDVTDVKIDLTTKEVIISTKASASISDEEVAQKIDFSGYNLVKIGRSCQ